MVSYNQSKGWPPGCLKLGVRVNVGPFFFEGAKRDLYCKAWADGNMPFFI